MTDTVTTNPLSNVSYSSQYYDIKKIIDKIPASQPSVKKELGELLNKHDIILLTGETGSGKSVRVPSLVLEHYGYNSRIVCTQPRTVNASNIAEFVSKILDVKLGEEVGYRFKHNNKTSSKTKLLYATDGTVVAQQFGEQARGEPLFGDYDVVIIDEAHERNVQIDFLLLFIKRFLDGAAKSKPPQPKKFIIMSATIELETFRKYFSDHSIGEISISGRTFPVEQHFVDKPIPEYMPAITSKIIEIVNNDPKGDILVFLPSKRDIDGLTRDINENIHSKLLKQVIALPLYSGLTPEAQRLAVDATAFKQRTIREIIPNSKINQTAEIKIVASTEIAETGVTVDGIVYVIESGRVMESSFDTARRENVLNNAFIPKAAVKQRIGRAGRTQPGIAYHMYTKAEYEKFPMYKQPDIRTTNIDSEIMKLLKFKGVGGVGGVKQLLCELIEPPSELQIKSTLRFLAVLNIITSDKPDGEITPTGECVYGLRVDTQLALSLLSAKNYKVEYGDMISVIAILQTESNLSRWFVPPPMTDKKATRDWYDFKKKYSSSYSDIFSLYRLYRKFRERKLGRDERFVRRQVIFETMKNRRNIDAAFKDTPDKCHFERLGQPAAKMEKNVIQAFMQGYYNQTATLVRKKNVAGKEVYTYQLDSPHAPELGKQTVDVELGRDNTMSRLAKKIMYLGISNINGTRRLSGIVNVDDSDLLKRIDKMYTGGVESVEDKLAVVS